VPASARSWLAEDIGLGSFLIRHWEPRAIREKEIHAAKVDEKVRREESCLKGPRPKAEAGLAQNQPTQTTRQRERKGIEPGGKSSPKRGTRRRSLQRLRITGETT